MTSTKYLTHFESNYKALASKLRDQIRSGQLQPGDRLPSFSEGRASGISQRTFEHAHSLLENEGLIRRIPRRGMFVEAPAPRTSVERSSRSSMMLNTVIVVAAQRDLKKLQQHLANWQGTEIVDHLSALKYNVMILSLDALVERELDHIVNDPPAAVVLLENAVPVEGGERVAPALRKIGRPVVVVGDDAWMAEFDRVTSDHRQGASELTNALISMGRRRILNVWPAGTERYWIAAKWDGFQASIAEVGLPLLEPVIIPERIVEHITRDWFDDEVRRFFGYVQPRLVGPERADAIMLHTDPRVGIMAGAIRLAGLTPNVDVAITGYDAVYTWWHAYDAWDPIKPLLTVDRRVGVISQIACDTVHKLAQSAQHENPVRVLVAPRLIAVDQG